MLKSKLNALLSVMLIFIAFFAINPAFSQSTTHVDSLTAVLNKYPKDDTVKVKLLLALSEALIKVNPNEGIAYSDKALAILEKYDTPALKADALYAKGRHIDASGRANEATDFVENALKIYEQLGKTKKIIQASSSLGLIYIDKRDAEKAKKQYEYALDLCERIGDVKTSIIPLNGLGLTYNILGNNQKAITFYEKALNLAYKYDDKPSQSIVLANLTTIYQNTGNYLKAIEYTQKTLQIDESLGDTYYMAYDYVDLGNTYLKLSDNNKAFEYFNSALPLALKTTNIGLEAIIYERIGACYFDMKQYEKAALQVEKGIELNKKLGNTARASSNLLTLGVVYAELGRKIDAHNCFQEALKSAKTLGNQSIITSSLLDLARLYTQESDDIVQKMGINPSERYPKALALATEGLNMSIQKGLVDRKLGALEILSAIYEKNKDYTKAYDTYKQYIALKDSTLGDEVKKQITRKEIQYEFDKKETVLKYEQQLTTEQLEKQKLLTVQGEQALTLNQQNLTLKEQALALSNKEKDLAHLAYLKEQAEKQEKTQELSLSQEREKGKERDLNLKNVELSAQQKQNLYLGVFAVLLLGGLGILSYFYTLLKKKNTIIAQQNELNEQTIAILSHDIKEPLLGVKLMLKKLNKDDPFVAQASQSLEGQINSVNGILNNLLKMKKLSLVKKDKNATANAKSVIQNVVQELNVAIQTKALTVHNELSDDVLLPIAPEKLQIVVHNLLSNAVKYSFPNQQIRIYKEGKGISIQDFGVGLSPEQRTKLMREVTASQQGTSQERGNGLGLFLIGAMLQGEQLKVVFDSPKVGGTIAKVLG